MRAFIRKIAPDFILQKFRSRKKLQREKELQRAKEEGRVYTKDKLIEDLQGAGIAAGDTLLVHSSLSQIGFVDGGPKTVVDALLEVVGPTGNLLMPTSPNPGLQLDYIKRIKEFNVAETPSALGAITEYFRKLPEAVRSGHPTEPVSCIGPDAKYFTEGHFGQLTPYNQNSPFYRVAERGGKILYLGVTLDNAGTSLHTLEDAVANFKFPVYYPEEFEVELVFPDGQRKSMKTKVHNPPQSAKRNCDGLIPLFIERGVMKRVRIGEAESLMTDAKAMFELMLKEYHENGVTMYTPQGE